MQDRVPTGTEYPLELDQDKVLGKEHGGRVDQLEDIADLRGC